MRVVGLTCAVADPEEVGGGVVVARGLLFALDGEVGEGTACEGRDFGGRCRFVGWGDVAVGGVLEFPGQSLLVFQEETFVTCEEVDGVQLTGSVCADGLHEAERLADARNNGAVFRVEFLIADMAKIPVQRVVQVCDAGRDLRAQVVVSGGRVEVGLHQAIGVQISLVWREAVQDVAPEAGNLLAVDSLHRGASRLCVLASHPRNAHDRLVPAPNEDERHLE